MGAVDRGEGFGVLDQFGDDGAAQPPRELQEVLLVGGRLAAPGAGDGDQPPLALDGQQHRSPTGLAVPRVGLDGDHGEVLAGRGRGAEDPGGVGETGVDDHLVDRRQSEVGQPAAGP